MPQQHYEIPQSNLVMRFTVRDLITIVSLAVSLALQWGVFGTRITVLEKEVSLMESNVTAVSNRVDQLSEDYWQLQSNQQAEQRQLDILNDEINNNHPR